jgi:hypothetical protein
MKVLKINRKEWIRGQGSSNSALLTYTGQKCCLGFYCLASKKITKKDIFGLESPSQVRDARSSRAGISKLLNSNGLNNDICYEMMETNDSKNLDDKERESKLTKLFKLIGTKVKFYN